MKRGRSTGKETEGDFYPIGCFGVREQKDTCNWIRFHKMVLSSGVEYNERGFTYLIESQSAFTGEKWTSLDALSFVGLISKQNFTITTSRTSSRR